MSKNRSFTDSMKDWYLLNFGKGQSHSYANESGYRDTQDDAINELAGAKGTPVGKTEESTGSSQYGSMIARGVVAGVQGYIAAQTQKRSYKAQAADYQSQVVTAKMNAGTAKNNMYNAYQMGAFRAMVVGLKNGQNIANTRAANAQSGVRMGTGSKAEVESSQRLMKEVDRITQQQNTTSAAMREYVNSANYQAQGIIAQGNADAANIMAGSISPFLSGLGSMSASLASSLWAAR